MASLALPRRRTLVAGELQGAGFSFSGIARVIGGGIKAILGLPQGTPAPNTPVVYQPPTGPVTRAVPAVGGGALGAAIALVNTTATALGISTQQALDILVPEGKIARSIVASVAAALGLQPPAGGARGGGFGHRRMNPLNPKALSRAGRRVDAFTKIAKRYVSCSHGTAKVRTKARKSCR